VGLSVLGLFFPLLLQWTRQSGSPVARSTGALPPVTLRLLRFIALVHRNHVSPFSSIHISTRRNSASFIGYKHAQLPSHSKSLRSTSSYMFRLAPQASVATMLCAGGSGVRIPVRTRHFSFLQTTGPSLWPIQLAIQW